MRALNFIFMDIYMLYGIPVDTGCKLSRTSSERLMYVPFTSCVYGDVKLRY